MAVVELFANLKQNESIVQHALLSMIIQATHVGVVLCKIPKDYII
jgi:hypothetical protein